MRFFLDNDVDSACAAVLRSAGHEVWTASEAGRSGDRDDNLTAYAMHHNALLVTHDGEFTTRRKRMPHGRHVYLGCHQLDGPELLELHLHAIEQMYRAGPDIVIELRPKSATLFHANGGSQKMRPIG